MHNYSRSILTMFSIWACTCFGAGDPPCEPKSVAEVLTTSLYASWNKGTVRAWDQVGDFFSMPFKADLKQISDVLKRDLSVKCHVHVFELNSLTIRITPRSEDQIAGDMLEDNMISSVGTTLGVFRPGKGDLIVMMYPAKIAAGIARRKGTAVREDLKQILAKFPAELDIEYNFGEFAVRTFGGTGKLSMREAADTVFSDLRRNGYKPGPGSDKKIAEFDSFFPPERHESFWLKDNSIARVELEKLKNGQVRLNLNDDTERSK